jgi:hypothetical protein
MIWRLPKSSYGEFEEIIQKSIKKSFEENSVKVADEKGYSERYIKWKQKLTEQLVNDQLIENDSGLNFHLKTTVYILMALNSRKSYTKSTSQIMKKVPERKFMPVLRLL